MDGLNHGPFGQKNFFILDGHWPCGPSPAMWGSGAGEGWAVRGAGGGMLDVGSGGR